MAQNCLVTLSGRGRGAKMAPALLLAGDGSAQCRQKFTIMMIYGLKRNVS